MRWDWDTSSPTQRGTMEESTRDEILARHIMTPAGKLQLAPYVLRPIGLAFGFEPEVVEGAIQDTLQSMRHSSSSGDTGST
jgi:hypothetical protein